MSREIKIEMSFRTAELAAVAESLIKALGGRILLPWREVADVARD
jgi:hypothetical protein